ncbi:type VI secretion system protein TssA [Rhizobium sp. GN54]|uniref:type VI secretion system protein TssA n=1 Tax=Rhizobium sp. GN54 TaxID=2898150 RepID=UPI001E43247D|nr:type VI secretion system protein TssA [Rhizobium sp. GN54]MCD2184692.1 type VI secretion system protein TssA [Rhizobium sp. GN54]
MLDLDNLLRSLDDDAPSGPDLEYDSDFTALILASQVGEERVVGASVIPAEEPDYGMVSRNAIDLLGRTRDIRIAVILANAMLKTRGLPGFEEVLDYIRRSLEDYWESIHPKLDEDDDNDPTMRINAVLGLIDRSTVLAALRSAQLADSRAFGRFALRDLQLAEGEISPGSEAEVVPTHQTISAAFQDSDPVRLTAIAEAIDKCRGHVKAIETVLDDKVGGLAPDLDPLHRMLHDIRSRLASHVVTEVGESSAEPLEGEESRPAAGVTTRAMPSGAIGSPEDVKNAIDRILDYYARHEPSSPIPLLLHRARRLVSADFVTILRDIAPQGMENAALIGGFSESDD